jgi:hypothetical protein
MSSKLSVNTIRLSSFKQAQRFGVDVLPGDPRLALTEDLLARDWGDAKGGDLRGIRTSLAFSQLLEGLQHYEMFCSMSVRLLAR